MLQSIEGVYENGRVDLFEVPRDVNRARVIVTFLPANGTQAAPPEFTPEEVAELRGRLAAWDDDWNAPGMEAYDAQ
jgi:hypothetical protein